MDRLNSSLEPMDVDISANSIKPMDISNDQEDDTESDKGLKPDVCSTLITDHNNSETDQSIVINKTPVIKKYHIKLPAADYKSNLKFHKIILPLVFFASLAVIIQIFFNNHCMKNIDLKVAKKVLISKLYGQDAAIDIILKTLELEDSKMLLLYGSTGVGKTYAVSLIFDSLWESANIYHYTDTSFMHDFSPHLFIGMTFCEKSVFIFDNLNHDDMNILKTVNDLIVKSENLNKNLTIILIYNCDTVQGDFMKKCDNIFRQNLKNQFATINIKKTFVLFDLLREEHLKKCIENELGNRKITKTEYDIIAQNFNVSLDGCKGVYSKMKFLNIV